MSGIGGEAARRRTTTISGTSVANDFQRIADDPSTTPVAAEVASCMLNLIKHIEKHHPAFLKLLDVEVCFAQVHSALLHAEEHIAGLAKQVQLLREQITLHSSTHKREMAALNTKLQSLQQRLAEEVNAREKTESSVLLVLCQMVNDTEATIIEEFWNQKHAEKWLGDRDSVEQADLLRVSRLHSLNEALHALEDPTNDAESISADLQKFSAAKGYPSAMWKACHGIRKLGNYAPHPVPDSLTEAGLLDRIDKELPSSTRAERQIKLDACSVVKAYFSEHR